MTIYLTEMTIAGGPNELSDPVPVAQVIPTPSVRRAEDKVIYQTGNRTLVIEGSNFREKGLVMSFDPTLIKDKDYVIQSVSSTKIVLVRSTTGSWRADPGPLKLKRIDTGGERQFDKELDLNDPP